MRRFKPDLYRNNLSIYDTNVLMKQPFGDAWSSEEAPINFEVSIQLSILFACEKKDAPSNVVDFLWILDRMD